MKPDTIKTYTIKPGDLVEATTALGDYALLRVEAITRLGIRVYPPTDPSMCYIISPEAITKIHPGK